MNNSYTSENGGRKDMSGTTQSRWHISTDVRNALALFVAAVTLLAAVWGVCESTVAPLYERFDRQDARFDRQDRELDQIGSRLDRQDARQDRLEAKLDKIETLLIDYILGSGVQGDESTPEPAARPAGPGKGASQTLPAKPAGPGKGLGH